MKLRKYIIYLIILVLLAGYYAYFEVYRKEKNQRAAEESKKVFTVDVGEVDQVKLLRKDQPPIVLVREEGKDWTITEPLKKEADKMEVEELLGYLNNVERQMVISEKTDDLAQYGLEHPSLIISFHLKDGWREIQFGDVNPLGKDYYAKTKDGSEVFVVASSTHQVLNKDLYKLRDKSLFSMQAHEVDELEIEKGDVKARFDKGSGEGEEWSLEGDGQFRVKKSKIEDVTRQFAWMRALVFEQEDDKDLAKYGLDKPIASVTMKKGDEAETILLGSEHVKGRIYAKRADKPGVVSIEARYLKAIPDSIEDFRDRTILSFDPAGVAKVILKSGGKDYELVKKEEKWTWLRPRELKDKTVEAWSVEGALWKVKDLEYITKARETDQPSGGDSWSVTLFGDGDKQLATLTVFEGGSKPEESLAKADAQDLKGMYWVRQAPLSDAKKTLEQLGEEKK